MDLVYVVGKGGLWGHNELKFSIRSAEKFLKFDRLFLVGYKPTFINDKATHILIEDNQGHKYKNVTQKVKYILDSKELSDEIIYMNDDFFLLKPYDPIPYLWNKPIREWVLHYPFFKGRYYQNIVELYENFPKGKFFETHFPIVYNRERAKFVMKKYQLPITLMLRSHYANEFEKDLQLQTEESKDYKLYGKKDVVALAKDTPFVSCTNEMACDTLFKNFLISRFPEKSSYEE